MWWWKFPGNEKEPYQEDLIAYEKWISMRHDRERMNRDKAAQKARAQQSREGKTSTTYQIPD